MSTEGAPDEWTAADVVAHCGWAADNGYIAKATASAMVTAVRKILEYVRGGEWAAVDVRDFDSDEAFPRFENLSKRDLSGQSMATYEGRFLKALDSYKLHQEDPKGWSSAMQAKSRRTSRSSETEANGSGGGEPRKTKGATASRSSTAPTVTGARPVSPDLVAYPFPVRQGSIAYLHLPADLRRNEASRLSAFLESLAIDEPALSGRPASAE